ncbi:MAG: holo-ACP synthase [Planctomycetaceae bacterium]|jgi:holo-[acyl-carrier protein] synthase|nr:holo-ACP synthase [Planctomycetaceae bacterium]
MIAVGTDIIECERIAAMLERHGEHFTRHVFTDNEIRYCEGRKTSVQHFAGRWAAKEAVLKALGTGWISGISWKDAEIISEASGKPIVVLHGGAAEVARRLGIGKILISISHCKAYAVATAAAVKVSPS